jgi:hypothetical protein
VRGARAGACALRTGTSGRPGTLAPMSDDRIMQVQVNTDRHISGGEALTERVEALVRDSLARFSERVTRVEVHLKDENSAQKGGSTDIRCTMEGRVGGLQPIAVTHDAPSVEEAAEGAAGKLQRSLESTLGRLSERR